MDVRHGQFELAGAVLERMDGRHQGFVVMLGRGEVFGRGVGAGRTAAHLTIRRARCS